MNHLAEMRAVRTILDATGPIGTIKRQRVWYRLLFYRWLYRTGRLES